ncbi:transporter [Pseudaminobacter soli (ex Li et al. 2025)]|uniref:Transporter n=1 Tax=Pseudaminobacter soli (ex Li et al. 2025) TaxID=1295366 RepID=A0A2P7S5V2_9HYPH|nr:transporter [Mesorhizobium soli]PSJ57852.1 transporter [Mesorhizobium soli]
MPPADDIQRFMVGAWRLMTGKRDGLSLLDISADGFWNSFFAIIIALPPLIVDWVATANELSDDPAATASRFSYLLRLAVIEMGVWILPLIALALAAPLAGIRDRFVQYVVAFNWGSAILAWLVLPAALLKLLLTSNSALFLTVSFGLFALSMVLTWRLTNVVIARGPAMGSAVFAAMFAASVIVLVVLQSALGIYVPR